MICSEWWAFEIVAVLSGIIGVQALAANTIFIQVLATIFMVPLGIQEATCCIIGNCIGANNVPLAKRFFKLISTCALIMITLVSMTVILTRTQIIEIFTADEDLIKVT